MATGNGDFRWPKVQALMEEADIVVTNPPFSLFREFISTVIRSKADYIILGNLNAISYKDIFELLKDENIWLGATRNQSVVFEVPEDYAKHPQTKHCNRRYYATMPSITFYTNIRHDKPVEPLVLTKKYDPVIHPKYDNYDAIEVSRLADIPYDYYEPMGVPITYMTRHDPEGFDIVGSEETLDIERGRCYVAGQRKYARVVIQRRQLDT